MKPPLISVIIPCYNQGHFLSEAVSSVLNQTYQNFEIIILNDGSTDDTELIAKSFTEKDKRIKYFFQENQGLSSTRNKGFALAIGDYIQFLDADDIIDKNKFKDQLAIFNDNPQIGICLTNFYWLNEKLKETTEGNSVFLSDLPLQDFLFKWERGLTIPIHCALFKKSVFKEKIIFNTDLKAKEDWLLWVKLASDGIKFHLLNKFYAFYRVNHGNNMCLDTKSMMFNYILAVNSISKIINAKYKNRFLAEGYKHIDRCYLEAIIHSFKPAYQIQLFYDTGNGFNEAESITQAVKNDTENIQEFTFELTTMREALNPKSEIRNHELNSDSSNQQIIKSTNPPSQTVNHQPSTINYLKAFRLDPLNDSVVITIDEVYATNANEEKISLFNSMQANAAIVIENHYFFAASDPQIYFTNIPENSQKLCVKFKYDHFGKDALHITTQQLTSHASRINELSTINHQLTTDLNKIHSSRGWKLLTFLYKIKAKLLPAGSLRYRIIKKVYHLCKLPANH